MAGGSYYLMSACQTADEFVAAFRRYAEKTMLFVPTQTPLPHGTKARMAVTLADGSVMIEGDVEIVGSTTRAVGLHARAGMSVRFHELDDTSRQVLDQLVRARLMSRPVPLPSHLRARPRAGTVPEPSPELQAERRRASSTVTGMAPVAPINAEAVPAECTLVEVPPDGDAAALVAAASTRLTGPRPAIEEKFDYSSPAPKDVELPAEPTARATPAARDGTTRETSPARPMTIKGPGPGRMPGAVPFTAAPVVPLAAAAESTAAAVAESTAAESTVTASTAADDPDDSVPAFDAAAFSSVDEVDESVLETGDRAPVEAAREVRGFEDASDEPTEATPPPVRISAEQPAIEPAVEPSLDSAEPVPAPPRLPANPRGRQSMSRTMLGVAPVMRAPANPAGGPDAASAPPPGAPADGSARAPAAGGKAEVFGQWWPAGSPDESESHDTQPMEPLFAAPPAPSTAGLGPWQGGDAAKLPPPPHEMTPSGSLHELSPAFAPTELAPPQPPPGAFPQPSPDLGPLPTFDDNTDQLAARRRPSPIVLASAGGVALLAVIGIVVATGGGKKPDAAAGTGSAASSSSGASGSAAASDSASGTASASAAASDSASGTASASGTSAPPAPPAPDHGSAAAATPPPAPPGPPIAPGACKAQFMSTPSGAEIVLGGKVIGTTPATLPLACSAATVTIRRARYQPKELAITPTADGVIVAAKLDRPSFTVKVTTTPAGATVTIAGKVVGRTPLVTKQPGFEAIPVTLSKDGYAKTNAKLYAKANGAVVAATLKKNGARRK